MNNGERQSALYRALYCAISILFIFAAFWSIRLARADLAASQPDLPGIERACRLASGSASYWLRAAEVRSVDEPSDPAVTAGIDRALAVNPRYTEARVALAVRDETQGRIAEAEAGYLTAANFDHMYKPAWALANFYLRQDQTDKFWIYARKCLDVVEPRRLEPASYDPAPVFELAWRVTRNAQEIRRRLIPPRHFILVDYLDYLGERDLADAGTNVAIDLAAYADTGDNRFLLNFCDRLIHLAKGEQAVDVWNAMVAHGTLHAERLDASTSPLTNGDLKRPFEPLGFDWRMPPADGVLQNHFTDTGEVRFQFSGDQPEGVLPLYQNIPVVPGAAYRLTFRYRTDMDHAGGLSWQLWDYAGQRQIPVGCKLAPHQDWSPGAAVFMVPKGTSVACLSLVYYRASGSTRIRGAVSFTDFALRLERSAH
jgi:hypothetical protein